MKRNGNANQSEISRYAQITPARLTQILLLLNLDPDIQEELLCLPRTTEGRDAIQENDMPTIVAEFEWGIQRTLWTKSQSCLPRAVRTKTNTKNRSRLQLLARIRSSYPTERNSTSMSDRVRNILEHLFVDGTVRVSGEILASHDEIEVGSDWVLEVEPQIREHWPMSPPVVDRPALKWSIRQFHGAAQLAVFRQLGPEEMAKRLGDDFVGEGDAAAAAYSVDLVFRFLPDLVRIVKGMNPDDPLMAQLRRWGERWPLSSVGIPGLAVSSIEPILVNRCLSMMYVDRIIEAEAIDRLHDPRVQELVRGAIGAYPELSPKLYRFLTPELNATIGPISHD